MVALHLVALFVYLTFSYIFAFRSTPLIASKQLCGQRLAKFGEKAFYMTIDADTELDVGTLKNTAFKLVEKLSEDLGKFNVDTTITSKEMNSFLDDYKEELSRRKVKFPGFRPGKIPPYAMTDVRKYLVSYALETTLGQLCNLNNLQVCSNSSPPIGMWCHLI